MKFIFALLILPRLLCAATVAVSDYGDHSGIDATGVSAAIAAAKPGDTVQMSAGTANWNSPVVINKGITLAGTATAPSGQGAGTQSTKIVRGSSFPLNSPSYQNPLILIEPKADVPVTIQGLWLDNNMGTKLSSHNLVSVMISNGDDGPPLKQIRLTNCTFNTGTQTVWWLGGAYGLIDHCQFTNNWICIIIYGGRNDLGDLAWARNDYGAGTLNYPVAEDCVFTMTSKDYPGSPWVEYHWAGGRSVVRHCLIDGTQAASGITGPIDCHGNQTYWAVPGSNNQRGTIRFLFYDNIVKLGKGIYQEMDLRGGSHLIYNNTFTTSDGNTPAIGDFRDEESDPHNTPGVPLRSPVKWPCEDQITATFVWNNTMNGAPYNKVKAGAFGNSSTSDGDPFYIKENRDYWLKEPAPNTSTDYPLPPNGPTIAKYPSPYASLQLVSYQEAPYPHPLAGGEAPAPTPTATPAPTATPEPPRPTPTPKPPAQTFEKWIEELDNYIRVHPPYPDQ
jgi:hypothetical protein